MAIRLLMFDLDGTLVDSLVDINRALNFALRPFTDYSVSVEETRLLVGEGVNRLFDKVLASRQITVDRNMLRRRFLDFYSSHPADHTVPYPGTVETLRRLEGCRKVIVSNKLQSLSVAVLQALGLEGCFDFVAGMDTSSERKPSPRPLLDMVERYGLKPHEAMMVGDSIFDVAAGRAAGVHTVAVTYGYGSPGFETEAEFATDHFPLIEEFVRRINGC